jgi:2-dehydro-3-deoxyphosphogluconate aldolase/(4S)-4-hydroxy-2-oxoglutarate aldolase
VDISAIAADVPEAVVGAGTVLKPGQFDQVRQAGARFAVGPGCTPTLVTAAQAAGLPFLPGIQTVSEAMVLAEEGFRLMKFFPADSGGGVAWLRAVGAPLAGVRFCPTGGIDAGTVAAYLALPNVACVGGSWVAPRDAVAAGDWGRIERLAAAASQFKRL